MNINPCHSIPHSPSLSKGSPTMANRRRRAGTQSRQSPAPTVDSSTQSGSPALTQAPSGSQPAPRTRRAANRRPAREASPSGEEIDLDGIGPDSDTEEIASVPSSDTAVGSLEPSPAQSIGSVQAGTSNLKMDSRRAYDVQHFFKRNSENTTCKCG